MTAEEKKKKKMSYVRKYRKLYKDIRCEKVDDIISRLALMSVTIDDCEEHLAEEGLVVEMEQGKYTIDRENPHAKILDRSMKTYQALIKQLDSLLPDDEPNQQDELLEFLATR